MAQNTLFLNRVKYDELYDRYKKYGVEVQPSYLRYEKELQNGVNHYPFSFEPSPSDSPTEKKLNKNDGFYVTSFTFGYIVLGTIPAASEGGTARTVIEANAPLRTFPVTGAENLEALYNGFLRITTGSKINIENLSTLNFKYIQDNLVSGTVFPEFQNDKVSYANISDLMLMGTKSHTMSIDIPAIPNTENLIPSSIAGITSARVKIVLQLNGYLLKNGAIIAQQENF